ncbi:threonine/serine ThrE exporter family protein [Wenyingzhuangia sp. IMCC45533]
MDTIIKQQDIVSNSLLEIGSLLMGAGASTNRIKVTIERIAEHLGYDTEILVTHKTVLLLLKNKETQKVYNRFKKTAPHGANFKLVSGISRMSWNAVEQDWNAHQIHTEIERLKGATRYPFMITLCAVSLADAAFCRLFGGAYIDMLIAFVATFVAFNLRHQLVIKHFNPYLSITLVSFTSCLIAGLAVYLQIGVNPNLAFATCVLFLIPGIPLINSFSDLIDGYVTNGIARGINAMLIAFSIALGMLGAMFIYNF